MFELIYYITKATFKRETLSLFKNQKKSPFHLKGTLESLIIKNKKLLTC